MNGESLPVSVMTIATPIIRKSGPYTYAFRKDPRRTEIRSPARAICEPKSLRAYVPVGMKSGGCGPLPNWSIRRP